MLINLFLYRFNCILYVKLCGFLFESFRKDLELFLLIYKFAAFNIEYYYSNY